MAIRSMTEESFVAVGRRHGSDAVALEARELLERWKTDMAELKRYGKGAASLARFEALVAEHVAARTGRPAGVAAKTSKILIRQESSRAGWEWLGRAECALEEPALSDKALAASLNSALPEDAEGLEAGIRAVLEVLKAHGGALDPDLDVADLVDEAPAIADAVAASAAEASQAKSDTVSDTREIDLLDGRIVTLIRGVNKAGRRAFRLLGNDAKQREYRYNHLAHRRKSPGPGNEPTPTPA